MIDHHGVVWTKRPQRDTRRPKAARGRRMTGAEALTNSQQGAFFQAFGCGWFPWVRWRRRPLGTPPSPFTPHPEQLVDLRTATETDHGGRPLHLCPRPAPCPSRGENNFSMQMCPMAVSLLTAHVPVGPPLRGGRFGFALSFGAIPLWTSCSRPPRILCHPWILRPRSCSRPRPLRRCSSTFVQRLFQYLMRAGRTRS